MNGKNDLKATGPKTSAGKAKSSKNAVKHGLLAASPALPGLENGKHWIEHRDRVFESAKPLGYIEELLTMRIVVHSWMLVRIDRHKRDMYSFAIAEAKLKERNSREQDAREKVNTSKIIEVLEALPNWPDDESLDKESVVAVLWALRHELPEDVEGISVPGVPYNDAEFSAFDQWTAGLLRLALKTYAAAGHMTSDSLRHYCLRSAYEDAEAERDSTLVSRREKYARMLPDASVLDKLVRYESHHERAFFRNLHELERRQASRSGVATPLPAAIDVDLNVNLPNAD